MFMVRPSPSLNISSHTRTRITNLHIPQLDTSSTAPDTDFMATFLDVLPNGEAIRLTDGVIRARFRDSLEHPTLLETGKVYRYEIDCWSTSILIKRGHRLRLQIASAAFPKF